MLFLQKWLREPFELWPERFERPLSPIVPSILSRMDFLSFQISKKWCPLRVI